MTSIQKETILEYLADLERRHIQLKRHKLYENNRPACFAGHVMEDFYYPYLYYDSATEVLARAFGVKRVEAAGIIHANDVGGPRPEDGIRKYLDFCPVSE